MKNVEDLYPLSPMQQGLLFHSLYAPESGFYVLQLSCTIRAGLNVAAFNEAWQKIMPRHPILRTAFIWEGIDEPLQLVRQKVQLNVEQQDWRGDAENTQQERFEQLLEADRRRGFDLSKAPLMRLYLIRVEDDAYRFLWSSHHILLDGWSASLLLKEVFTLYEAFVAGQQVRLEEVPPYSDYIAWLQEQDKSEAEAFWRQTLAGFTVPTPFGIGRPALSISEQDDTYGTHKFSLSADLTSALQTLARQQRLTLNTLIQGAWALLLSRYSREKDVVFGMTVSGRPAALPGVEQMIGLFINTLPVRVRVPDDASLLSWLKQLQEQQIKQAQYDYTPLIDIQGWSDVERGQPLFESILGFENYPVSYFYLWTAAMAWLVCVALLWLLLRWGDAAKVMGVVIVVIVPFAVALGVYAYLLSKLPSVAEKAQVLIFTREPDLLRVPEIVGAFILVVLFIAVRRGRLLLSDPRLIFTASFGLVPFLIFNQQVVTGRSLQPFHYEIFIANYVVLAGVVMLVKLLNLAIRARTAVLLVLLCLSWAAVEVGIPSPIRSNKDVKLDQIVPVLRRLNELAKTDGTWQGLREHGETSTMVFSPEFGISRLLPAWAPQGLLLGTGSAVFQGVSQAQRKEWIYTHLYYCGKDEAYLREFLNDRADDPYLTYFIRSNFFGPERILLFLGQNSEPVSQTEIETQVAEYASYARSFSRSNALKRPVTYVITRADDSFDFSRVDQWYERDEGERVGDYVLYRVRLRD